MIENRKDITVYTECARKRNMLFYCVDVKNEIENGIYLPCCLDLLYVSYIRSLFWNVYYFDKPLLTQYLVINIKIHNQTSVQLIINKFYLHHNH
jgi:hypothetical protein